MISRFKSILTILCFFPLVLPAQDTLEVDLCQRENFAFEGEEKLRYRIYYNWKFVWIPAGEVEFSMREDSSYYNVEVIGRTYPAYENFYKVNDFYGSRINKSNLLPDYFLRNVEEGSYNRYDSIMFDQDDYQITSFWGKQREDAKRFDFEVEDCVQDMVSILYFVRNLDFDSYKKGTILPLNIFFDKELYPVKLEIATREKKKIKGMGKFKTIRLIPEAVDGHVFDEDTKMDVWISDDDNRIPLLIESPLTVGSAKAVLIRQIICLQ